MSNLEHWDSRAQKILDLMTDDERAELERVAEEALKTGKHGVLVTQTETIRTIEVSDRIPYGTIAAMPIAHREAFLRNSPVID